MPELIVAVFLWVTFALLDYCFATCINFRAFSVEILIDISDSTQKFQSIFLIIDLNEVQHYALCEFFEVFI